MAELPGRQYIEESQLCTAFQAGRGMDVSCPRASSPSSSMHLGYS